MAHFYIIFYYYWIDRRSKFSFQVSILKNTNANGEIRSSSDTTIGIENFTRRELKFDSLDLKWLLQLIVRRIDWVKSRIHRREGINQFSRKLHVETVVIKRITFLFRMIRSMNKKPLEKKRRIVNSIDWQEKRISFFI